VSRFEEQEVSGTRVYVGNLPESVTSQILRSAFLEIGDVLAAKVILDPYTGKSRGFGFVEMKTSEMAAEAIEAFDRGFIENNEIRVSPARPLRRRKQTENNESEQFRRSRGERRPATPRGAKSLAD